jgi:hypothetical protein
MVVWFSSRVRVGHLGDMGVVTLLKGKVEGHG